MTWYSTWPSKAGPAYAEHETEAQAEKHAEAVVRRGDAAVATYFRGGEEAMSE